MHKILVVARREYLAAVATRTFLIGLALMPVMMGGGALLPQLLRTRPDVVPKRIAVLDETGVLGRELQSAARQHNENEVRDSAGKQIEPEYEIEVLPTEASSDELRLEQSDRVRDKLIFAFVELPRGLVASSVDSPATPLTANFYADGAALSDLRRWIDRAISDALRSHRLQAAGLDPAVVQHAVATVTVNSFGLLQRSPDGQIKKAESIDRMTAVFLPLGIMMAMFTLLWMTAQPSLESIMEEKQQRISEVLLGSIRPAHWMLGKLVGNVACSFTTLLIYLIAALGLVWYMDAWSMIPWKIVPWFLVYQFLGVFLFSSLFMSVGAAATSTKDAQGLMMPLLVFLLLPMFVWFNVIRDPASPLAVGLSFYPPATPLVMVMRMVASSTIPWWQPPATIIAMAVATAGCVIAAARIFRIGILSQGHTPSIRELITWVWRG